MSETPSITSLVKTLDDSKFYHLAQTTQLLKHLIPDIETQLQVELYITTEQVRTPDDGNATRILINYTNYKKNSMLYPLLDTQRLDRTFDIDHFLNGYVAALEVQNEPGTEEEQILKVLSTVLSQAACAVIGISSVPLKEKLLYQTVLQSVVSILFNDPLDVILVLNDVPPKEGEEMTDPIIVGLWIVKNRVSRSDTSFARNHVLDHLGSSSIN